MFLLYHKYLPVDNSRGLAFPRQDLGNMRTENVIVNKNYKTRTVHRPGFTFPYPWDRGKFSLMSFVSIRILHHT